MNRRAVPRSVVPIAAASVALALAGGLSACGSSGAGASTTTIAPVESGTVEIAATDNYFVPEDVTVTEGSEVVWTNDGRNEHNIVAVGDTPFSVEVADFEAGDTYRWKASVPGTYRYYCSIHGTATAGMIGAVQVVAP